MLHLEAESVAQLKAVDQSLLASIGMGHVVQELVIVDLIEPVMRDGFVAPDDTAAIRRDERLILANFLTDRTIDQRIEPGIEHVEDEPAAVDEMVPDAVEAGQLIGHGQQML